MKQNYLQMLMFILLALQFSFGNAQEKTIKGSVTALDSFPLVGAEVKVLSTKQVVKTDSLGNFTVVCNSPDKIRVSGAGFYTQKIQIPEKVKMLYVDMKMKTGDKNYERAIGYARTDDIDQLNSVAIIDNKTADFAKYTNMFELIRGRLPGVMVVGNEIIIRGIGSLNGSNAALIVVDGVPSNEAMLETMSPADVKDIQVLKGGAAAIYGVRGANGVVLIKTKTGKDN